MLKRFLSFTLLGAMLLTLSPLALAEDMDASGEAEVDVEAEVDLDSGSDDDSFDEDSSDDDDFMESSMDDEDDSLDDDDEDEDEEEDDDFDSDDLEDEASDDDEVTTEVEVDATVEDSDEVTEAVTEVVDLGEFESDDLAESTEVWVASDYADLMHVSVRWGFFNENVGLNEEAIDSDGSVSFEGESIGFPEKLLRWERNDSILYPETDAHGTAFESEIVGYNDGILFRTKTNLGADADMVFTNEEIGETITVPFSDLSTDEDGEIIFTYENDYQVVFNVWTREDWLAAVSERISVRADDAEAGAWYQNYMRFVINKGFFNGYADVNGRLTGMVGPADNLTRFQAIKVVSELANELNTGLGATECDASTVVETSATDWMGDHWARGYVQCIENSGIETTLLNDVIHEDVLNGQLPTLRVEVVVLIYELLELEVDENADSELTDLQLIGADFRAMIESSVELGIISGYPDGRFAPYSRVNRAEMFKIVNLFYEVLSLEA